MEHKRIMVGIIDDHKVFRVGIETCLKAYPEISIAFHASNGRELIEKLDHHHVDVILLDLNMPGISGIDVIKEIRKTNSTLKIIILTMHDEESYILKIIEENANAYLLKDAEPQEIYFAIQSCMQFGRYYTDTVNVLLVKKLFYESQKGVLYPKEKISFSERELNVVKLICEEKTTAEIAEITLTTERTIDGIRKSLLSKMEAKNTIGIVLFAIRNNLVFIESVSPN